MKAEYLLQLTEKFYKQAGVYTGRYEELAERYKIPLFAKRLEDTMAKKGFPGEVGFIEHENTITAIFTPNEDELGAVAFESSTFAAALIGLIDKIMTKTLFEFQAYKK